VRDRYERAANDLDPRRTCSGDSSSVSEASQSRGCLRFGDGVFTISATHALCRVKLGSRGSLDMVDSNSDSGRDSGG
jgi:hypothetical protein